MAQPITVAQYLEKAIDLSGKTQRVIAEEVGFEKPNILSMMKKGITKVPIERAPALAKACGVDQAAFLRLVMREYMPHVWETMTQYIGDVITEDEREVLESYRRWREKSNNTKPVSQEELDEVFSVVG